MDKLAVNTEIVSMRHDIRKARVHTINKLVRTSKKLKNKHGSEKEKEKYQRKAARFMEEITIMKSLKDDEISKFALTNLKAPDDILNDLTIPLREKALARLCGHPNVITRVCQFRTKFPSWEDTLPTLLEQLGTKKKKKNAKTKPQQKSSPLKVKCGNINSNSVETSELEEMQNTPSSSAEMDTSEDSKCKTIKINRKRKELEIGNSDSNNSKIKVKPPGKSLAEVKRFSEILKSNDDNGSDDDDEDEEQGEEEKDDDVDGRSSEEDAVHSTVNKTVNEVPEEKTVDPFFMCEDGETEYLTKVKKVSNENGHLSEKSKKIVEDSSWKRDGRGSFGQRERRRGQVLEPKNFNVKSYRRDNPKFGNKSKVSYGQKTTRPDVRKDTQNGANEPIHPSWEAKKRLKEQQHALSAFQGKKIKFED